MGANVDIKVHGVKEALKELKLTDPTYKKLFTKESKRIAKPVTDAAKAKYPPKILSGLARHWSPKGRSVFPYDQAAARRGVKVITDTNQRHTSVLAIVQMDVAAAVIDITGKADIGIPLSLYLTRALNSHASRVMWPAYEENAAEIEQGFRDLVGDVMKRVGKKIAAI